MPATTPGRRPKNRPSARLPPHRPSVGRMKASVGDGRIAVTGAGGRLGARLAFRLAAEGARQRLILSEARRAPHLTDGRPLPEVEVVACPGSAPAAVLAAAFAGVDTVFLAPPHPLVTEPTDGYPSSTGRFGAPEAADPLRPLDAALAAGVRRVVLVSQIGAAPDAISSTARDAWYVEERLRSSGLRWTILRLSVLHSRLTEAVQGDVLRAPVGDGRVAAVSHDDVADVATAVLLDERARAHDSVVYRLTGPEALGGDDVARVLSEVVGRQIRYDAVLGGPASGGPDSGPGGRPKLPVDDWLSCCEAVAAGVFQEVSGTVARFASRPARSLADWLDDYPAEWAHLSG